MKMNCTFKVIKTVVRHTLAKQYSWSFDVYEKNSLCSAYRKIKKKTLL